MTRLARLLNQRPSFIPSDEIPRRLSWERYVTKPTIRFLKYEGREGRGGEAWIPLSIREQEKKKKKKKKMEKRKFLAEIERKQPLSGGESSEFSRRNLFRNKLLTSYYFSRNVERDIWTFGTWLSRSLVGKLILETISQICIDQLSSFIRSNIRKLI